MESYYSVVSLFNGGLERRWRVCSAYGVEQRKRRKRQQRVTTAPEVPIVLGNKNESSKKTCGILEL